jgi:hypothetical protein
MKSQHLGRAQGRWDGEGSQKRPGSGVEPATQNRDLHALPDRSWRIEVVVVQLSKSGRVPKSPVFSDTMLMELPAGQQWQQFGE